MCITATLPRHPQDETPGLPSYLAEGPAVLPNDLTPDLCSLPGVQCPLISTHRDTMVFDSKSVQ